MGKIYFAYDSGETSSAEIAALLANQVNSGDQEAALQEWPQDGNFKKFEDGLAIVVPFLSHNFGRLSGLQRAKEYRLKTDDYATPFLFLMDTPLALPDFKHPEESRLQIVETLLARAPHGQTEKAVLMAEVFFDEKGLINFIPLGLEKPFVQKVLLLRIEKSLENNNCEKIEELRKAFYNTFVSFYEYEITPHMKKPIHDIGMTELGKLKQSDPHVNDFMKYITGNRLVKSQSSSLTLRSVLELAEYVHRLLNGTRFPEEAGTGHSIPLELFAAPIPFPLQELCDAWKDISRETGKFNLIRFLLIDNKEDKYRASGQGKGPLLSAFAHFFPEYEKFIEIRMLSCPRPDKKEPKDTFCASSFLKGRKGEAGPDNHEDVEYVDKIYKEIKEAHFILLDFFLNEQNTYLAIDFIKDLAKLKRDEGDPSSSWYFITSAIHDAVTRYARSGLLAEYYESSVVSAGDDPTNKKRQIIFIYKLLTFVNARIRSFQSNRKMIEDKLMNTAGRCLKHNSEKCGITCLREMLSGIRKYQNEYDSLYDIIYKKEDHPYPRKISEIIENIIKQFIWLPEADWPRIQRQIELADESIERVSDFRAAGRRFSCTYIKKEMKYRANIY